MKKVLILSILLIILSLALAACDGGATATGVQSQCNPSGAGSAASGVCQVTIGSLRGGAYPFKVENNSFRNAPRVVDVTARISVGQGTLIAWLAGPNDRKTTVTVGPGQTVALKGLAQVTGTRDDLAFRIYLEPQGEGNAKRAEDVRLDLEYTSRDL